MQTRSNLYLVSEAFKRNHILVDMIDVDQWRFTCASYAPPEFYCTARTATIFSKLEELMGQRDIKVGAPTFDRKFQLFSNEPSLVVLWFSEKIQELMLMLRRLELFISGETLHLDWRGLLSVPENHGNLFALFDALRGVSKDVYSDWESFAQHHSSALLSPNNRWDLWRTQLKGSFANYPLSMYLVRHRTGELLTCIEWQRRGPNERYTLQRHESKTKKSSFMTGFELDGLDEKRREEVFPVVLRKKIFASSLFRIEVEPQWIKLFLRGVERQSEALNSTLSLMSELSPGPISAPYR